jgi:hypothetical protein
MNLFSEKSMLFVTALTLGLIIAWLISTDTSVPANADSESMRMGHRAAATHIADKT